MKTLELNLNKRLLIVELPDDQEVHYKDDIIYKIDEEQSKYSLLPKGEFKLLCKGSDLTEDIANRIVSDMWKQDGTKYYNNYNSETIDFFDSALESFISAIESNGWYWKDPLGISTEEIRQRHGDASDMFNEWVNYESRTFNPGKCLIFKIL